MKAPDWFSDSARACGGWHAVPGTSILLRHVLPSLAAGASHQDLLRTFPSLPPAPEASSFGDPARLYPLASGAGRG